MAQMIKSQRNNSKQPFPEKKKKGKFTETKPEKQF